jgi:hypothetical protein
MPKSIRVIIGGKEYSLKGESELLVQLAADELNLQLEALGAKHLDETNVTISTLAALNIAEKHIKARQQNEMNVSFLKNELNSMANYIKENL